MENIQEKFEHFRYVVDQGQSSMRIDKFLFNRIENATRNKIQDAAKEGDVLVNGIAVKSSYKIKPGDIIVITASYEPTVHDVTPEDIPLDIVYEDETLLIVNKKPEMVVHPSYGHYSGTMINALMHHLKDLPLFSTGELRPGLVHRIDKNTSGLLVVAKTEEALAHLGKQFFDRTTDRRYIALIWGVPKDEEGTIIGNIGRNPKNRKLMYVFPDGSEGKHAITHYKVIEKFGYTSLVECKLETGRTHQIRVHMQYLGHPLFNDNEYGGDKVLKGTTFTKYKQFVQNCFKIIPRQALHAKTLAFEHPFTHERMSFTSELPEDLTQVIEKWRAYVQNRQEEIE